MAARSARLTPKPGAEPEPNAMLNDTRSATALETSYEIVLVPNNHTGFVTAKPLGATDVATVDSPVIAAMMLSNAVPAPVVLSNNPSRFKEISSNPGWNVLAVSASVVVSSMSKFTDGETVRRIAASGFVP